MVGDAEQSKQADAGSKDMIGACAGYLNTASQAKGNIGPGEFLVQGKSFAQPGRFKYNMRLWILASMAQLIVMEVVFRGQV